MTRSLRRNLLATLWLGSGLAVAHAEPPAPQAATEPALARFEGGRITPDDMERALAVKAPPIRAVLATPAGRVELLRDLVDWDLLVREAARRGYAEHPAVVAETEQAAIDAMIARDLAPDSASIARDDIERRYREDPFYRRPPMRRASHVELATEAEAAALAAKVAGTTYAEFAAVARERSTNPRTRRQGGELGWFTREGKGDARQPLDVPTELVAAAFASPSANEVVANPVAHGGRFSVLMVTGEKPEFVIPIGRAEAGIREQLVGERTTRALDALVAELKAALKPAVVRPELLSLVAVDTRAPDVPSGFPAAPPDPRAPTRVAEPDDM